VNSFASSGLTSSTTYRFRVIAFNITGTAVSNIAAATTSAKIPVAPSELTATAGMGQVSLAWSDNSFDETGFAIHRCAGAGCTNFARIAQVGANVKAYNDTSVAASTAYRYRVYAVNAAGNSSPSNIADVTTGPVPAAPASLTATAVNATSVSLRWNDNSSNESGFRIERCSGSSCNNFVQVGQVGAGVTTFTNGGLSRNQTYRFRVRAFNANGSSGYSNTISVRTPNR
jgi:titin